MSSMEVAHAISSDQMQVIRRDEDFMPVMVISRAIDRYNAILDFTKQIMKPGKDYGEIPGTDKPTLLKPGAEKLCSFFGLAPKFAIVEKSESWDGAEPFFYYWYKCQLWRGERLIGEGDGSANSRESKYRYRWVNESNLPPGLDKNKCEARGGRITEFEFAIDKAETSGKYGKPAGYWQAFKDAIANGTATHIMKPMSKGGERSAYTIDSTVYRIPNPDVCDSVNTLQKMAQKRAFIAATLIACNASEYYTQDLEDLEPVDGIDTGGHPVGTQAAANHIAEQKIEELRKQQPAPKATNGKYQATDEDIPANMGGAWNDPQMFGSAEKKVEAARQNIERANVPPHVQAVWARMRDFKATLEVFTELKRDLCEALGKDAGDRAYYGALGKQGVEHSNQFKTTRPARLAAQEMVETIADVRNMEPAQ